MEDYSEPVRFNLSDLFKRDVCCDLPEGKEYSQPDGIRDGFYLYNYQLDSVSRMLERENSPKSIDDPAFEEVVQDGKSYWIDSTNPSNRRTIKPSPITESKGGILCEEMGTGKTAICIGLILSTKGRRDYVEDSLNFLNLPSKSNDGQMLSLKDLCCNKISSFIDPFSSLPIPTDLQEYLASREGSHFFRVRPTQSKRFFLDPLKVYLTHATLVIVPSNLLMQWTQEFNKFVKDGFLKVLIIGDRRDLKTEDGPLTPEKVATYDVVIVTHSMLSHEKSGLESYDGNGKTNSQGLSFLVSVNWYRVIIDEGHVMGGKNTNLTKLAGNLFSNRMWCCSGTPTPDASSHVQLQHLQGIINLIKQAPYVDAKLWTRLISTPFCKQKQEGKDRLVELLSRIMIRHRIEDITKEVLIPPLHVETAIIDLADREKIRYNQVVALIQTNLITSRYEGTHSLFDSTQRKHAMEAILRLSESCYFRQGITEEERNVSMEAIDDDFKRVDETKSVLSNDEKNKLEMCQTMLKLRVDATESEQGEFNSKMNYVMEKIQSLPKDAKCLLFTQYNDSQRRILDYLDRVQTFKFAEFHTKMSSSQRSSAVITFNTSDEIKVIVMKTELAAYGINLTSANHIFLIDPVWDINKESQAIKRAHRIGQRKEVYVYKLIAKDSIEELLLNYNERKKAGSLLLPPEQNPIPIEEDEVQNLKNSSNKKSPKKKRGEVKKSRDGAKTTTGSNPKSKKEKRNDSAKSRDDDAKQKKEDNGAKINTVLMNVSFMSLDDDTIEEYTAEYEPRERRKKEEVVVIGKEAENVGGKTEISSTIEIPEGKEDFSPLKNSGSDLDLMKDDATPKKGGTKRKVTFADEMSVEDLFNNEEIITSERGRRTINYAEDLHSYLDAPVTPRPVSIPIPIDQEDEEMYQLHEEDFDGEDEDDVDEFSEEDEEIVNKKRKINKKQKSTPRKRGRSDRAYY